MHCRVHAGENERVHGSVERTESSKCVGVFSNRLLRNIGSHLCGCPAVCRTGDASEPCFILKQQTEGQTLQIGFEFCSLEDQGEKTFGTSLVRRDFLAGDDLLEKSFAILADAASRRLWRKEWSSP